MPNVMPETNGILTNAILDDYTNVLEKQIKAASYVCVSDIRKIDNERLTPS